MEEHSPNRPQIEALAAQSAAAVRSLRDRAQRLTGTRDKRLADIEEQINAQLELVRDELARDAAIVPAAASTAELDALDELRQELARDRTEWERLHEQQAAELQAAQRQAEQTALELSAERAQLDARIAELETKQAVLDEHQAELSAKREETEQLAAAVARERAELEAAAAQFQREQDSAAESDRQELERLQQVLEQERANWRSEREELETSLSQQTAKNAELSDERDETARRLHDMQQSVKTDVAVVRNELSAQAATWQRERAKLTTERGDLADELQTVRGQLAKSLEQEAAASAGLLEIVPKFELAMEDVRRLRARVAELEQELAKRPERDQTDLPELIQLRTERDALSEQVAVLESRLASEAKADDGQQLADLQRRFEMAVEDVRQLKTEKAELVRRLAERPRAADAAADAGATDWEAQKQRLLASLEGEGPVTPERRTEQASIEGTIRITDEVVAQKDREIEALRQQLDEASSPSVEQVVDADESIRSERERLAALEAELNEKLRVAEMELSVARAKLARQESELEKQRSELEAYKKAGPTPAGSGAIAQAPPKRRWLNKLGLGGDDEGYA
jgi:chromosome segregation ATPase